MPTKIYGRTKKEIKETVSYLFDFISLFTLDAANCRMPIMLHVAGYNFVRYRYVS